tara:strand:- start:3824 stop:4015 length:192 start_codon:yes stop_codon:yes gene_type:complete
VQVGDLVREKTRMSRKPEMGIVLAVDFDQKTGKIVHPYQVYFFDDKDTDWMREGFLEVINESR